MSGPIAPGQFALAVPAAAGTLIPEPTFVGSILDRPEHEFRNARKFATAADAACYRAGRPHLAAAEVVGPFPGEGS